jgi:lipoprotein-anchoring transpeptidase ErfK/SrfK
MIAADSPREPQEQDFTTPARANARRSLWRSAGCHHNKDVIDLQTMRRHRQTVGSDLEAERVGNATVCSGRASIHSGAKTMRQARVQIGTLGLLVLGLAATVTTAAAQNQGACRQIRLACEGAGFTQGAAREGVGLQVHCIIPIMQTTAQPPSARRPLPRVDAQLVADCLASNPGFGQPRTPQTEARAQPPGQPAPDFTYPNGNPPPASAGPGAVAPIPEEGRRPSMTGPGRQEVISGLPVEDQPETGPAKALPPQFRRTVVDYRTKEPAGTIIIDTPNTYLYLVTGNGKAMRYGIGVGREGFTWTGTERISRMAEWPDWNPPPEMIERQPYLPRFMAGGESNPLGARALYLGQTLYRIHGTNQPSTIGTFVSSGCIRLTNEDIMDLYGRVQVGTRVVVLPGTPPRTAQTNPNAPAIVSTPLAPPPGRAQ